MLKIFPTTLFLHNIKGYFSLIRNWSFDLLFAFGHWIKCQIGICWRVQPVDHKVRWPYCAELTVSHLTQVESTMLSCDLFLFLPSGPGKWELAPTIRPQFWKQDGKSELVFVENVNCWINNNYREDLRQTLSCHPWFAPQTPKNRSRCEFQCGQSWRHHLNLFHLWKTESSGTEIPHIHFHPPHSEFWLQP